MATSDTRDAADDISPEKGVEGAQSNGLASNPLVAGPLGWVGQVKQFWREVGLEMKKVAWPAQTEVVNTTVIVVIAVFFFAAYLFVADIIFSYVIQGIEWGAGKVFG
jgi:preprotein translocase SecE subunit